MFGLTALETRLSLYALLLVVVVGFLLYERHEGAASVVAKDRTAEIAQQRADSADAQHTLVDLHTQLSTLPSVVPDAVPMRVCFTPSSLSPRPTTRRVESVALPIGSSHPSVQAGTQSGSDIGPIVQDLTLAGVLAATDAYDLWQLAVKESTP
jgi:hypothetical protein